MAHQPDAQKQQDQQQRLQELQNIVYVQQDHQNYRNQNYRFTEEQSNLIRNQLFQQQNANFGQFENNCPFVNNGHFSPSNSSATIIQSHFVSNKSKNAPTFKSTNFTPENTYEPINPHQRNDATFQLTTANYQSLNYQQSSHFFLPSQYQLNDILVPAYQSSGSSESSDESSISNISQSQYSNESNGVLNNQFEFPAPVQSSNQVSQNFQQFQQKDFLENYTNFLHQDPQIPRCDSSKSEAAESTCSSLSSGSTESQSENESIVQLPVIVNPVLNNNGNCNIFPSYQSNTHNNIPPYPNQMHHTQPNNLINHRNYSNEQGLLTANHSYGNAINANSANSGIMNSTLPSNNQVNNLVVMLPNPAKNIENCLITNQSVVQNPSVSDISKFLIQNQKANQQKLYGLINVPNQFSQEKINPQVQVNPDITFASRNSQESSSDNDLKLTKNSEENNGSCSSFKNSNNTSNNNNNNININNNSIIHNNNNNMKNVATSNDVAGSDAEKLNMVEKHSRKKNVLGNGTSQIHNTSDSSVINTSFTQTKNSTIPVQKENSAMFLKETSDKNISQCISDVNSTSVDSSDMFLVKSDERNVIKNNCYEESSASTTCVSANPSINVLPVPTGWKRLLVDGSIIYLSPGNIALSSIEQVKMYLQTVGTCKCGLECPLHCDSVFNFNPKVLSRPWDFSDSEVTRLCNHKRKAPAFASSLFGTDKNFKLNKKDIIPTKRKKKKHGSSGSGVSVSQLLAQRDRALAAAAARWSLNSRSGPVGYHPEGNKHYQNIQIVRNQDCSQISCDPQPADPYKPETTPVRLPDFKTAQFPCVNVINNSGRDGAVVNINGITQLLPENNSADPELLRSSSGNLTSLINHGQEMVPGIISQPCQPGQEYLPSEIMDSRPEGVVLTAQGMVLSSNMIMQRPRPIPPWHQTKMGINKKQVPETPLVYDRVSCVQQHMPPPALIFEDGNSRKKHKSSSKIKRAAQEPTQNQPSFMENPSAYLAQQTALLHNTISLPNFGMTPDNRPVTVLPQNVTSLSSGTEGNSLNTFIGNSDLSLPHSGVVSDSKNANYSEGGLMNQKVDQNKFTRPQVSEKNALEKIAVNSGEVPTEMGQSFLDFPCNNHVCTNSRCSVCNKFAMFQNQDSEQNYSERQINKRVRQLQKSLEKSNSDEQIADKTICRRFESAVGDQTALKCEEHNPFSEENPVTSSTEKPVTPTAAVFNQNVIADSRPIQGGTVSTSNGSPQPQPSPKPSAVFRQDGSSPKYSEFTYQNSVPSSKSFAAGNVCSSGAKENEKFTAENTMKKEGIEASQNLQAFGSYQESEALNAVHGYKVLNCNFLGVKSCDQKFRGNPEEQSKGQSVSSTFDVPKEDSRKEKSEVKGSRVVRTMASGHTVSSNTITSVQAGKTQTATVTVNSSSPISPTMSLVNFSNHANMNIPVLSKGNAKSPLEMVQSVVSSIQTSPAVVKSEMPPNILTVNKTVLPTSNVLNNILTTTASITTSMLANSSNAASVLKTSPGGLQTGHIFLSNNGQYIVASNGNVIPQTNISSLKLNQNAPMPSMSATPVVTSVTGTVTQVLPAVGVAQQVLGQPTVLVNALPAPFVIQPGVMAVDTGLGRLTVATGNVVQSSLIENNSLRNSIRGLSSPEKVKSKKGSKKKKSQVPPLVQMASPNNIILNQPFNQQNFALSPGGNVQSLQALTLLQGKHGGAAQIMMNNQNNFNQFSAQPQQINLLQPVNLTSVPNFPAFQQFIVPGLGNMVMSTDGTTTLLPDANIGVQLQLQNVNGQNVLTPVQNASFINGQGILTTPAGMLIRAPNNQQKIIQNNSNSQFLSPNNGQFLVNQFQGQLSPLIAANLSPNQQIFTSSPPRQSPQEYIQIIPPNSSQNTTVVQQNTTIVQQQTTMVSNNQNILSNAGKSNFILNNPSVEKPVELQFLSASQRQVQPPPAQTGATHPRGFPHDKVEIGTQHSVSTQTVVNQEASKMSIATNNSFCQTLSSNWSGSPPDTTTHSPIESDSVQERALSPLADVTPDDCLPQAMVQYVSSSISENEIDGETYLLPGIPKMLPNCDVLPKTGDKAKNIVESSTVLQESGIQIQIADGYVASRRFKSTADERIVSSHSDITVQDKHVESRSNITSYQEDKARLMDALLSETGSDTIHEEASVTDSKEKLSEGDLVWGSARGSLAWPGKLVGPVSPEGKVLVRWFGGHGSPSRVHVSQLQSLSQGLEAHHRASNKGRKNRRLNVELESAIQEAMLELDKMSAQEKKISPGNGRPRRWNR